MTKQCPSCGGDCGRTNLTGCQYQGRARNILATGEMEDIRAILKKWGYNTVEACIESYLLGINRRRKANFDLSDESIIAESKAVAMWATENTPQRELMAFKDGYHAATMDFGVGGDGGRAE